VHFKVAEESLTKIVVSFSRAGFDVFQPGLWVTIWPTKNENKLLNGPGNVVHFAVYIT